MSASMPLDTGAPARHALAAAQVEAYERDGFLFPLPVFTAEEAAARAAEIAGLPTPELQRHPVPWVQKSYLFLPTLDRLMRDERLTGRVASILGDDLLVLSADLFIKAPGSIKRITWHQDVNYWGLEPLKVLTAWIAFTPATIENGCMHYSPGAHRGRLKHIERKADDNMLTKGQEIAVEIDDSDTVAVVLAPGEVAFHDGLAPHASGPNRSETARIGFAIRYVAPHVRQTSGPAISARLARGIDRHGHFALEEGPDAALSPASLDAHLRALSPHSAYGYSTV
jgi:non-haem Fe2+, alpha-ketoglutarate-dependent halogenase